MDYLEQNQRKSDNENTFRLELIRFIVLPSHCTAHHETLVNCQRLMHTV